MRRRQTGATLLLCLLCACSGAGQAAPAKRDSPERFLRAFLERAREKDYDGLKELIYPARIHPPSLTVQDAVIMVMKENRPLSYTGDFSYSDAALERIIEDHVDRFTSEIGPSWLKRDSEGGLIDDEILKKTGRDPKHFRLFDYRGCHILLVMIDGQYKLLFWEGMNHLLKSP